MPEQSFCAFRVRALELADRGRPRHYCSRSCLAVAEQVRQKFNAPRPFVRGE
ncbi:hypothetical protein SAMN05421805_111161 [Saccharopolyspora antimicrobica]|uniref:Uncharacterized protein n=1 Tax=Saccharopolyspora antimicrobica TaxID=455193 RepID=A0A1I5FNA1_9PSEU|nr:hypothetical protein [Saccharopolyspora antimicrobica]RKT82243.1 hypothetical protein ATL45_0488 [Saccharopolyspora antimicrobica]SFO25247.1 hypothetical protein SAMN05421805_111161 [Saccharopolyspora antimicrobica]